MESASSNYLNKGYYTEPIECKLFQTWLHQVGDLGVPYEALSYHWSRSDKDAEITLDGCQLKITRKPFHGSTLFTP